MSRPRGRAGKGLYNMRRYLRWTNGHEISPAFWVEVVAAAEEDAVKRYCRDLLARMSAFEGEHFNFLMTNLHNEAER